MKPNRKCITLMPDRDSRCYVIPTVKETKFLEWEASVIGGEEDEYHGEDFSDYRCDRPLATLGLTKPYRRFSRRSGTASRRTSSTSSTSCSNGE